MVRYLQAAGSAITKEDFALHKSAWSGTKHVSYRNDTTVHALPPTSQGAAGLALLQVLDRLQPMQTAADEPRWTHHAVTAKRLIYTGLRASSLGEGTAPALDNEPGDDLADQQLPHPWQPPAGFDAEALAAEVQQAWTNMLPPAPAVGGQDMPHDGDTVGLSVVDASGLAVSLLQSNGLPFGAGLASPRLGFAFQNRGSLFALDAPPNHPNQDGPHRRPFHTLSPFLVSRPTGTLLVAMKGGDRQPYAFAQVLTNLVDRGMSLSEAIDAPRWRNTDAESRSPWLPNNADRQGDAWNAIEFDVGFRQGDDGVVESAQMRATRAALETRGYTTHILDRRASTTPFEDSGFGVVQVVAHVEASRSRSAAQLSDPTPVLEWVAVSDVGRKPGYATSLPDPAGRRGGRYGKNQICVIMIKNGWYFDVTMIAGPGKSLTIAIMPEITSSKAGQQHTATRLEADQVNDNLKHTLRKCPPTANVVALLSNAHEATAYRLAEWGVPSALPSLSLMLTLGDKQRLTAFLQADPELRAHALRTYEVGAKDIAFPVIAKTVRGSNGNGVRLVSNDNELQTALEDYKGEQVGLLIQEAVASRYEFTINFIALHGIVLETLCARFSYSGQFFVKNSSGREDGRNYKAIEECNTELYEDGLVVVKRIAAVSHYHGIGCLQYKRATTGTHGRPSVLKVIEVNPRPCGSLIKDLDALPRWLRLLAVDQPVPASTFQHNVINVEKKKKSRLQLRADLPARPVLVRAAQNQAVDDAEKPFADEHNEYDDDDQAVTQHEVEKRKVP